MTGQRVVWLASYPKSGNTWLRFLLYCVVYGVPERSADVVRRIPDIHQRDRWTPEDEHGPYRFIKSHFELTQTHPMLEQTCRAIHIIRDPRDVILSALNYRDLTGQGAPTRTRRGYVRKFIRRGGDRHWCKAGFGTWASHADSWRSANQFPVLGIRYEDLKADLRASLEEILAFLEIDATEKRVRDAIEASSFSAMQATERREKASAAGDAPNLFIGDNESAQKGLLFVSKGASGQSLDTVATGLDARLERNMGEALSRFGYA